MNVLFFLIDLNLGGTEKSLLNLIQFLPENYRITILVLKKRGALLSQIPKNIVVKEIDNSDLINSFIQQSPFVNMKNYIQKGDFISTAIYLFNYIGWKLNGDYTSNFKTIDHIVKKLDDEYDIAVSYAGPHDFISYFVAHKVQAKKRIQWIHFDVSKIGFNKITSRNLYKKFNDIKVVSGSVKQQLLKVLPELEDKIKVQYNLISGSSIIKQSEESNVFVDDYSGIRIVTVGRLTKEKGHELFIPVLRRLVDENYNLRWYVVGDGGCMDHLKSEVSVLNLENHIIFVGSTLNPYTYMGQCDIYLQPSFYEGHCVTILEAKVLNRPIVCTGFSGATEEVENGVTGFVVDISSEGIYNAMKTLLDNGKLSTLFSENLEKQNAIYHNETIEL